MKKIQIGFIMILLCLMLVACGDSDEPTRRTSRGDDSEETDSESGKKGDKDTDEKSTDTTEKTRKPKLTPTNTPKPTPTNTPKPTSTPKPSAEYFGNRSVQYEEENSWHQVFFSFSVTEDGELIRQDAIIHLAITNDDGVQVYKGDHSVTDKDYSMWSSTFRGTQLLGCIYIKDSEITQGTKSSGVLTIWAELKDGSYWNEERLQISDLPVLPLQITIPQAPVTLKEYGYDGKTARKMEIVDISYEVSDWGTLTVSYTVKLLENKNGKSSSDYCYFGYKLKNSDGVIIDSGMCMAGPLAVGEAKREESYMGSDLDRGESYTLEFYDYK